MSDKKGPETVLEFHSMGWSKIITPPAGRGRRRRPCKLRLFAAKDAEPVVSHALDFGFGSLMDLWEWADSLRIMAEGEVGEILAGREVRYIQYDEDKVHIPPMFEGVGRIEYAEVDSDNDWTCNVKLPSGEMVYDVMLSNLVFVEDDEGGVL